MQNAIDYVNEKELKASVGVIGVSLEDDGTKTEYYNQIKGWVQSGNVEIWNTATIMETVTMGRNSTAAHMTSNINS